MIETYFGSGELGLPKAFLASLLIGLAFGFVLERAGFGSSRRLAGIFYFRDMTVLKVMFTAVITAMLGMSLALAFGWIDRSQIYTMPTIYAAQAIGGLLFGVGFVMSGWCPGTGAVGAASGKIDALVFLVGAVLGSIAFNETYGLLRPLTTWGAAEEPLFAFGLARPAFALLFTLVAVGAFHLAEWIERRQADGGRYLHSPFLRAFSLALVVVAAGLLLVPEAGAARPEAAVQSVQAAAPSAAIPAPTAQALLEAVESGEDHLEPEELAERLIRGQGDLVVVDLRPPAEYQRFHIKGAVNVPMTELLSYLEPYKNRGMIVLYSNGMTHPAQARDVLAQAGYGNAYLLTNGLQGFLDRCLKPVSLRAEPLSAEQAERVRAWRAYFLASPTAASGEPRGEDPGPLPGLVETAWLAENLHRPDVKLIDVRPQPEYNTSHIPGSRAISVESFRGFVGSVPSMLLPAELLASHLSLMGIRPTDLVVIVPGDAVRDATLIGMGLSRVGHQRWAILNGGFAKWIAEKRPLDNRLPEVEPSTYPVPGGHDGFSVDAAAVLAAIEDGRSVILDVRPADYFRGRKSDEARAGHIPGAINRPYREDLGDDGQLKPREELAAAYRTLIPSRDTPVIVHCRTGHQASQTFFVLKHLLGYTNIRWYDAGWTEWAARPELPVVKEP